MIASIGLVSVATLFPMSVLRSIKAAQITGATDNRKNAEAMIDLYPDIIKHPDSRNALFNSATNNVNAADPNWLNMQLNGVKNYIVDPLGFVAVQNLNLTIGSNNNALYLTRPEHFFGNDPSAGGSPPWPNNPPGTPWSPLPRYPLNFRTLASADYLVTLPDSWVVQAETIGGTLNASPVTQITLSGLTLITPTAGSTNPNPFLDPNLPATAYPQSLPYPAIRVVMFSVDGTVAQTRTVTSVVPNSASNTTTFIWTEDINGNGNLDSTAATTEDVNSNGTLDNNALPASFISAISGTGAPLLGKVRVEMQERRYSWLLTVRQSSPGVASVDVVVFFKRSLEDISTNELLYETVFTQGSTQAAVTYPTGSNSVTGLPLKPYMRRGSFVFDANNAFWYRIANVSPVVNSGAGWEQVNLTLEVPANATTGNPPFFPPRAMFPRGVVDVFPIGTKTYQQ
jgi:hypothetical protein